MIIAACSAFPPKIEKDIKWKEISTQDLTNLNLRKIRIFWLFASHVVVVRSLGTVCIYDKYI